jgi:metal-responsive CopG/Arc/MetJ family transcriptional regulator
METNTIQLTLDADLLARVDQATQMLGIERAMFIEQALEEALRTLTIIELERQHRAGYEAHPISADEFESN